jgi:hypothetical protein
MMSGYRSPNLARCGAAVIDWATQPRPDVVASTTAGWDADDWEAARWAIQVHGIAPLLDWTFESSPNRAALPERLQMYLAEQRRLSGQRVERLLGELAAILEAANRRGIAVAPLKGSLLATSYYAEPGLRPMNDLDLLVRPDDEARMLDLLAGLGYRKLARGWKHIALARPDGAGPIVSYDGEHPDNPRSLELHVRVAEQFWGIRYDLTSETWAGSAPGTLLGAEAQVSRPAALLHHLAVHASSDAIARRLRLLHLHDIALVAAQVGRAGWEQIARAAQARREERLVYPALLLASRYYPIIPADVLATLRAGVPLALLRHLDESGIDHLSYCNTAPTTPAEKLCWFRPGRERIGAIRHMLIPDPSEMAHWFPRMGQPILLPLAYARYSLMLLRWGLRRARGRPRMMLR